MGSSALLKVGQAYLINRRRGVKDSPIFPIEARYKTKSLLDISVLII